jgi:hypothetical protein
MMGRRFGQLAIAAVVGLAASLLWHTDPAQACLHPPVRHTVAQSDQVGLIYHREGRQELLLSARVDADEQLPRLGWVVPVPAVPDEYGTADPGLFDQMAEWVDLRAFHVDEPTLATGPATSGGEKAEPDLKVLPTVQTGPYDITPLQATGRAGKRELVAWLKRNDFAVPETTEPVDYYIERGWTFLAARIDPAEGSETVNPNGRLPPLHLSFASERAVYPLKFETHQGQFSVRLYVLTDRPLPPKALAGAVDRGFFVAGGPLPARERLDGIPAHEATTAIPSIRTLAALRGNERPGYYPMLKFVVRRFTVTESLAPPALADVLEGTGAWRDESPLYLRTLYAPQFNSGFAEPDEWTEDLAIPPTPEGERLTGSLDAAPASSDDEGERASPSESDADRPASGCSHGGGTPRVPWEFACVLAGMWLRSHRQSRRHSANGSPTSRQTNARSR